MKLAKKIVNQEQEILLEQLALKRLREIEAPPPEAVERWRWRLRVIAALRVALAMLKPGETVRLVAPGEKPQERHEWERIEQRPIL